MTYRNGLASLLRPEDSVLVLIDHQAFQLANVNSHDPQAVVNVLTMSACRSPREVALDLQHLVGREAGRGRVVADHLLVRRGIDAVGDETV